MAKLYIMQGLPGTGKSTLRSQVVRDAANNGTPVTVISKDEIRAADPSLNERQVHAKQRELLHDAMAEKIDVVLDNCNLDSRTLKEYEANAKQFHYQTEIVRSPYWNDVETAVILDQARRGQGNRYVGRSVIRQMAQRYGFIPKPDHKPPAIIVDLDGTLCDISHRRHFVDASDGSKKNWSAFFEAIPDDTLNPAVAKVVQLFYEDNYHVIYLSGRNAKYRRITENWIEQQGVDYQWALYMRRDMDRRDDTLIKAELYDEFVAPYFDVKLVLDDRSRVVNQWREKYRLPTFQVAPGDF